MDGVGDDPMALYPMVEEAKGTGTVAAVYAQIVAVMPIVPSVFKSLALCPPYLVLAWDQAAAAMRGKDYNPAAAGLAASVHAVTPRPGA